MDMPQSKRNENRYFCGTDGLLGVANRLGGVSDLIRLDAPGDRPYWRTFASEKLQLVSANYRTIRDVLALRFKRDLGCNLASPP